MIKLNKTINNKQSKEGNKMRLGDRSDYMGAFVLLSDVKLVAEGRMSTLKKYSRVRGNTRDMPGENSVKDIHQTVTKMSDNEEIIPLS